MAGKRNPELKGTTYHERKLESQARYDAEFTKMVGVKMNKKYDADILAFFETIDNKQAFIKQAIRDAIAKAQKESESITDVSEDPESSEN